MAQEQTTYFFIAGPPKGGTTWLMRLMDAHPEASCSGEGHYFDRFRPLLERAFVEYKGILDLDAKLVFSEKPILGPLRQSHITGMLRHFVLDRFQEYAGGKPVRAFGDKTPNNWKNMQALFQAFPEAVLIFINRDPRDAAVSLFGHARRRQLYKMDPEGPIDRMRLVRASCENWLGVNRARQRVQAELPDVLVAMQYETLLADTVGEYRKLCGRLGLSTEEAVLQAAVEACSFSKMSGRAQGQRDETSFFTSGTSGGWRDQLQAEEVDLVLELCGDLMPEAGYLV